MINQLLINRIIKPNSQSCMPSPLAPDISINEHIYILLNDQSIID